MVANNYPMLSSDGHLEVLPERWTGRMPAKYRHLAPRTTILPDGSDAIVMADAGPFKVNYINLRGGSKADDWQLVGVKVEQTPGIGPPEQRLAEQDADGLSAEVLFPRIGKINALFPPQVRPATPGRGEVYTPGRGRASLLRAPRGAPPTTRPGQDGV